MKIRMKDSYDGPIAKDVLYDALRTPTGGYLLIVNGAGWSISGESVEEVDEFEEEFSKNCIDDYAGRIYFPGGHLETESDWVFSHNGRLVHREDIPALILALLKLMDE